MAVKIALAVGLFIVICVLPGLKSSQVVPDDLVYTEFSKTLVRGVQGVLTCRFYGDPAAVYWKKGLDPDDLSIMVVWLNGKVSGPRYDDGSCDVDENYSLFINNVSTADAGRIHCIVLNYNTISIKNYTDILVVDTALTTSPQVTLHMRQATYSFLKCTVNIEARIVSWKKSNTSSANESLVVIENNENVFKRSGTGYDQGTYNITQDYSLVIKDLQIHHEGLYVCEVTDDYGISFRNCTFVNVFAQPLGPFPTIQVAKSRLTATCQALKYYPSINLLFLYGSRVLEPSYTKEFNNTDGTKNKTISIATRGNKELYTCVASSIPGTNANKSSSVSLHGDETVKSTLLIILVLFGALIFISSVAYFIWRKKHPGYFFLPRCDLHQEMEDVDVKDLSQKELQALEQCVNSVLMRRYREIYNATETNCFHTGKIIRETNTAVFDTHQMVTDWQQRQTSTTNQYITAYLHTFIVADKSGPVSNHAWPTNEELKSISRHLTQESMKKICKELQIAYRYEDATDEGKRFDSLWEWRNKVSDKPLDEIFQQIFSVLESTNLRGLLPVLKGPYIYKAELVDLAFHLLINDLFPYAKDLGISVTKLVSYRPAFHPSHLAFGTIKLLIELFAPIKCPSQLFVEDNLVKRSSFCRKIKELHSQNVAIRGVFEYDISYGELCSISEAINQNTERRADQEATSCMLPEAPLGNLQDVLQLTDQDIADYFDTSHPLTSFELVKIWKEKPRPSMFNYRASLNHGLRRNGIPDLADEIIAGKYITKHTSLAFIENMVQGLNQVQIKSLGELLQLSGDNEHWHTTPLNDVIKQIYDWVADWSIGFKGSWRSRVFDKFGMPIAEKHINLNDKLVEHGFLDLAREIMIIEHQQQQLDYSF